MHENLPIIILTTQIMITVPIYILWGVGTMWLRKKLMLIFNKTKDEPYYLASEYYESKIGYQVMLFLLRFFIIVTTLLALIITPALILYTIVGAFAYNFWGWNP